MLRRGLSVVLGVMLVGFVAAPGAARAAGPTITAIQPSSGPLGTRVIIRGTALAGATAVTFNGTRATISSVAASAIRTRVPVGASTGKIAVTTPTRTVRSQATFTVTEGIVLSASVGPPSTIVRVSGSGFTPGGGVSLLIDGAMQGTITASAQGTFIRAAVTVPADALPGTHEVQARDAALSSTVSQPFTVQTDWPSFRNGPTNLGVNATEHIISTANVGNLALAWSSTTNGQPMTGTPVLARGILYVSRQDGWLLAFDATGCSSPPCAPLWKGKTGPELETGAAVANGVVFVGGYGDRLYAFDAAGCGTATCSPLWTSITLPGEINGAPNVVNGVVYFGGADRVWAFSANGCGSATCSPLWHGKAHYRISGMDNTPAVSGGTLYIGSNEGNLYAYDAHGCGSTTCDELWKSPQYTGIYTSPAVDDGFVFVSQYSHSLMAFPAGGCAATTCLPAWTAPVGSGTVSSAAVADGTLYVGSDDHRLYAFAEAGCGAATCPRLWRTDATGDQIWSSPTVANGVVYAGSFDGMIYAWDAAGCGSATCSPLWSSPATGGPIENSAIIADGMVFAGSDDGSVYAYTLP